MKILPAALVAVALAGCSVSSSGSPAAGSAATAPATLRPAPDNTGAAEPHAQSGARAAAVRFDRLYQAGRYAASWMMLAPAVRRQIPQQLWVRVHQVCQSGTVATSTRAISAVTVFGTAAIVTETVAAGPPRRRHAEEVFSYVHGQWAFSPNDLAVYHHGSAAADIAAARAAGLCASWESF
ncbi:MAG: hypothetical protein ACLPKI_11430 [Streptosporangiaceae bacterium]